MDRVEFHRKLRSSWQFLNEEMKIGRYVISPYSLKVDAYFNQVCLDPDSNYRDIYLSALSRSYYNIILLDYSILQYSWHSNKSLRMAYFPNPWIAGVESAEQLIDQWESLESIGDFDEEVVSGLISELPYHGSIPPIRFEYALDQYREISHPAAHLHIGRHTENRWPVARLLNPITFTMTVSKMYYSAQWAKVSSFFGSGAKECADLRFIRELQISHSINEFSNFERQSLHISSS